jgi:hypothetical protein
MMQPSPIEIRGGTPHEASIARNLSRRFDRPASQFSKSLALGNFAFSFKDKFMPMYLFTNYVLATSVASDHLSEGQAWSHISNCIYNGCQRVSLLIFTVSRSSRYQPWNRFDY